MRHHLANALALMVCLPQLASLVAARDIVFPPDAVVDVTRAPYAAIPDDGQDDTAALQRAICDQVDTGRFLYLPAGTYDVNGTLTATNRTGVWRAHLTLQGAGRDRTVLRLANAATGFGDALHPKPVVATGSHWNEGDAPDGGGNKAFRNNLMDLTIDTGRGNPGAVGIAYAVSNIGTVENVTVRDPEGTAATGISMTRRIPGPGLLKHVTVEGFGVGLDYGDIQYGMTAEHLTLRNQREAGIRLGQNVLHVRGLASENRVPAVQVTAPQGMLTLLDADLRGGSPDQRAIDCAGSLLLRNVRTQGYAAAALRCAGRDVDGPDFAQYVHPAADARNTMPSTALLPVEETPVFWNGDLSDWQAVGARQAGEQDDTAAIQRAFDAGKGTVYFPCNRTYFLSDTVVVRGTLRQVLGMGSEISLGAAKEPFSNRDDPRPLIRIDGTAAPTVFLEHLFFNAQYPGEVLIENNTPATVVIRHCSGWVGADGSRRAYRNTPQGTGKLFVEDAYLPGWEFTRQTVWARQLNPENWDGDGSEAQVLNRGGKLWVLGFKTEGPAPFIDTVDGGATELLGAYNYVSATKLDAVPADAIPYSTIDSRAALTFTTDNFRDSDYRTYLRQSGGGATRGIARDELPPRNGNRGDRSTSVPLNLFPPQALR
jgi:hypothetical protein